ncbi:hypothetical protein BDV96DRAFT_640487 [Lophiotrema nucula]|uniref:Heterokaryon incompatibility domain-containing protein n=1 Tax=Lophiotrema nucula TaxID=690887 RepID=A0A6A5ZQC7_9PLEO|nr:hypothetical protein BDV96DRAFT_640487 [Lophiotrema nucula]
MKKWHVAIEEYSSKALTRDADVFPALQGVAKILRWERNCEYYAGLWADTLIWDLLWIAHDTSQPAIWRAPSWSWASVKDKVLWDVSGRATEIIASVVDVFTTPVGTDSFGQLKNGLLWLRAPCIDVILRHNGHYRFDETQADGFSEDHASFKDSVLASSEGVRVRVAQMVTDWYLTFIRVDDHSQRYKRIGIFDCRGLLSRYSAEKREWMEFQVI